VTYLPFGRHESGRRLIESTPVRAHHEDVALNHRTLHSSLTLLLAVLFIAILGCSDAANEASDEDIEPSDLMRRFSATDVFEIDEETIKRRPPANPDRNVYFGDLHVHTTYSFDAFAFGTVATPSDAYRYARGEKIKHPAGFDMQLREPLDFYAVTDHAMFLGVAKTAADTSSEISKLDFMEVLHDLNAPDNMGQTSLLRRVRAFGSVLPNLIVAIDDGVLDREAVLAITRSAWQDTIDAAEQWNEPGRFTTFSAYEYTSSSDDRGNLHRNVIFRDSNELPAVPFSRFHSQNPEGLWDWMDALRAKGIESLAIPHNSNGSNGQMFKLTDWAGNPMDDAYAERRLRNEPLVEITQIKGTSETHPSLSTTDEWADFEITPYRVATLLPSEPAGSYVRDALKRGLFLESGGTLNPYKFGFVGASDTHTGATSDDEANFHSKLGILDSTSALRSSTPMSFIQATVLRWGAPELIAEVDGEIYLNAATPTYGASGLTGAWAEENTRGALYDAFRRKETFATSGPRIQIRFFAGLDFEDDLLESGDLIASAYAAGVSMGSELMVGGGASPEFLVLAVRDPLSAPLQRLQIIKGWEANGETFEAVYDIACSDGLAVDPTTRRCPDNGARVDLTDCSITRDTGDGEMRALWSDPDFDADQRAFYYVRVLENPTCRWSTWDALREGVEPRTDLHKTLQERAWSSPIGIVPTS
jgi:hypothetical protein